MNWKKNRGFSMLELVITVAICLTMAGVTFIALTPLLNASHVDAAYDTTFSAISNYRSLAITQTRRYILLFTAPGTITVQYWSGNALAGPGDGGHLYVAPGHAVRGAGGFSQSRPESLSDGTQAVAFNPCTAVEAGQPCLIFYPDGSAQDDMGNYNSGVIYLIRPGDMYSSRAVSIIGPSGKIRGWRLYNQSGNVWVQQ